MPPVQPIADPVLAMLACPACHGGLTSQAQEIVCDQCERSYPVRDGIPVLIVSEALPREP